MTGTASTLDGESKLTFNGSTLTVTGTVSSNGVYSFINSSPSTMNVGVWGVVGSAGSTTQADIGGRFIVNSGATLSNSYGITVDNTSSGTGGLKIGSSINVSGYGSSIIYGVSNLVSANAPLNYGVYTQVIGTSGTIYGYTSNISGLNDSVNGYGVFNTISSFQSSFGVYTTITGTNSLTKYGVYTNITGTGSNYGEYITITSTGSLNYGIYIDSSGAVNNYGLVVNSGTSIFNEIGGDYDFRIEGLTESNLFFVDASTDNIGIGTSTPNRRLDVLGDYQYVHNPTNELTTSGAYGDIVTFGSGSGFTSGGLYYYGTSGTWAAADADSESTSKYLLAIALGSTPASGMLLRGYAKYTGTSYTSMTNGGIQFISATAGSFTETAPTNTGQIVRIIGYCIDVTNDILYFNPSNDWIQL